MGWRTCHALAGHADASVQPVIPPTVCRLLPLGVNSWRAVLPGRSGLNYIGHNRPGAHSEAPRASFCRAGRATPARASTRSRARPGRHPSLPDMWAAGSG